MCYNHKMNAMTDVTYFFEEWKKEGITVTNIVSLYSSCLEKIQSSLLRKWMHELLLRIQERMKKWDLGKVIGLIHNIPLEYSLYEGVSFEDKSICNKLYTELLAEHDRLFEAIFPDQFRKKIVQIVWETPA